MTDRELLEAAARAAGLKIDKSPYNGGGDGNTGFDMSGDAVLDWHNNKRWNPLRDDGDALRLAVRLGLVVCVLLEIHRTGVYLPAEHIGGKYDVLEEHNGDPYAATRRAIVRAAAAIGTNKEGA